MPKLVSSVTFGGRVASLGIAAMSRLLTPILLARWQDSSQVVITPLLDTELPWLTDSDGYLPSADITRGRTIVSASERPRRRHHSNTKPAPRPAGQEPLFDTVREGFRRAFVSNPTDVDVEGLLLTA